ncbi:protein BatD [uncultured Legionella sp.]|uniref:protein BatD n=1 Tax=uncultured Legionella sp. TaxID=210934 RepID=UPI00262E7B5A|nr:protein BatD [uncultured Legionella sp.]
MKKIIICVFLSIYSIIALAEIQVQIEPGQVAMGETFKLILTDDNPQNGGVPDLSALQKEFAIVGTERHVNYVVINGQAQSASQWIISLQALKSGILTIPAIKFGLEQSNPITINVDAASKASNARGTSAQQQDIMLTAAADEKKPYINQQVIYTVKLFNSKRLLDVEYQGPKVDNALIIPLGDSKRYQTIQNNTNYVVEEQNYAIFPQKSGSLNIISPTFTALVYDINPQRIKVEDKTIKLTVQPIPSGTDAALWLPARQVNLTETYENSSQTLSQGSTLTRTVTLEAVAIPAQLLPKLKFEEGEGFSVYPEKGTDKNQVKQGQLNGSTSFKVTYLFNKAGKVIIPELRLHWFNTETGTNEVISLAPRSIDITPSATSKADKMIPDNKNENRVQPLPRSEVDSSLPAANQWAWLVAFLLGLAWIITLGLWLWQKRGYPGKKQSQRILDELSKACKEGNPHKTRDALLKWGRQQWPDAPLLNLADLSKLVRDAQLKKQIFILSQVLYQNDAANLWRGDELLRAVIALKRSDFGKKQTANILPPINPF